MDGVTRMAVVNGLSHPWGLTIHQNHLYYTDLDYEVIERVDKDNGANMVVMRSGMSGLRALKVHARDSKWIHWFLDCIMSCLSLSLFSVFSQTDCYIMQQLITADERASRSSVSSSRTAQSRI